MVAHPFNPVYLLPLVELVGAKTDQPGYESSKQFYASIGMHPLHCREGNRRFPLSPTVCSKPYGVKPSGYCKDKVATAAGIDDAIAFRPRSADGRKWAPCETYHLAGGEGGMRAMLAMFGPCLKWPWTKLMDVPEFTDDFINEVGDQCEVQADGLTPFVTWN